MKATKSFLKNKARRLIRGAKDSCTSSIDNEVMEVDTATVSNADPSSFDTSTSLRSTIDIARKNKDGCTPGAHAVNEDDIARLDERIAAKRAGAAPLTAVAQSNKRFQPEKDRENVKVGAFAAAGLVTDTTRKYKDGCTPGAHAMNKDDVTHLDERIAAKRAGVTPPTAVTQHSKRIRPEKDRENVKVGAFAVAGPATDAAREKVNRNKDDSGNVKVGVVAVAGPATDVTRKNKGQKKDVCMPGAQAANKDDIGSFKVGTDAARKNKEGSIPGAQAVSKGDVTHLDERIAAKRAGVAPPTAVAQNNNRIQPEKNGENAKFSAFAVTSGAAKDNAAENNRKNGTAAQGAHDIGKMNSATGLAVGVSLNPTVDDLDDNIYRKTGAKPLQSRNEINSNDNGTHAVSAECHEYNNRATDTTPRVLFSDEYFGSSDNTNLRCSGNDNYAHSTGHLLQENSSSEIVTEYPAFAVRRSIYEASDVQIIKSVEEQEAEARKRYIKKVILLTCIHALIAVAIAVPISIAFSGIKAFEDAGYEPSVSPTSAPTFMPSVTPRTKRYQEAASFISYEAFFRENNLLTELHVNDRNSPQARALSWVADEDPISPPLETNSTKFLQRYIMAVFYFAMDGPKWIVCSASSGCRADSSSWLSGEDECNWRGIKCVDGEISEFHSVPFSKQNLRIQFPEEICYFTKMTRLLLTGRGIEGTIPACLGRLSMLKYVNFNNNHLNLPIPEEVVNGWTSLIELQLSYNEFDGPFPQFILNISTLRTLAARFSRFTGPFPAFNPTGTPILSVLQLNENTFVGEIPETIFDIPTLTNINFVSNRVEGPLPANIGQTFNGRKNGLIHLSLGRNLLTGSIPDAIYNATDLQNLDLSFNNFTGQVRSDILTTLIDLRKLTLNDNMFTGPVPETLAPMSRLEVLDMQNNNFNGQISKDICDAKDNNLIRLTFDCHKVTCSFPCCDCP